LRPDDLLVYQNEFGKSQVTPYILVLEQNLERSSQGDGVGIWFESYIVSALKINCLAQFQWFSFSIEALPVWDT